MDFAKFEKELQNSYRGYIIHFGNYDRNGQIEDRIRGEVPFSEALSSDIFSKGKRELFFITLDGENIIACSMAQKGRRVVTGKSKVDFKEFVNFSPGFNISQLSKKIASNLRQHFIRSTSGDGGMIPPKTWKALLIAIKESDPESYEKIIELYRRREDRWIKAGENGVRSHRKDASSVALSLAQIDPLNRYTELRVSRNNEAKGNELDDLVPPFLQGIESRVLLEDQMINHDSGLFDNWIKQNNVLPDITAQFRNGDKVVTISNFNRHKVEQQLGVDLLYYNHHYNSYALIQYKRLDSEKKIYRPTGSVYEKEYNNMKRLVQETEQKYDSAKGLFDYRLSNMFCYFKLCEAKAINQFSNELITGMYFPLDLWELLLSTDYTKGKKGGTVIGYEQSRGRYLNNTEFIDLFKKGWIGSSDITSDMISEIINTILDSKHSLILASSKDS